MLTINPKRKARQAITGKRTLTRHDYRLFVKNINVILFYSSYVREIYLIVKPI